MYKDYRRYQRYSVNATALITRQDESLPEKLMTQVTTISQGGIGFYANALFKKTTPVIVELLIGTLGTDILMGKIAYVCSQGKDYFVGVSFDNEIAFDRFVEIIG